jgi:KipI family sensor histidine kinase inhibitor
MSEIKVFAVGGNAIYVELCKDVSLECNRRVHRLYYSILSERFEGIKEVIPAYSSLLLIYDPTKTTFEEVSDLVKKVHTKEIALVLKPKKFRIPVLYGGEFGPDLSLVVERSGLSEDEVIRVHTSRTYTCYMLGFTPGFVYLGDVDDRIATPRLPTPRLKVPAGSVGIAGKQTGWYGVEGPGGWVIIGRTPVRSFNPDNDPPSIIKPGDEVEFYKVEEDEFKEIEERYKEGGYELEVV